MDGAMLSVSNFSKYCPINGHACWMTFRRQRERARKREGGRKGAAERERERDIEIENKNCSVELQC